MLKTSSACTLLVLLACLGCATARRPQWPDQYMVSFNFSVPYVETLQEGGLVYTYKAWQNYADAKQKVIRDDLETVIIDANNDVMYQVFPAKDEFKCWKDKVKHSSGPTLETSRQLLETASITGLFSRLWPWKASFKGDSPQEYLGFVLPDLTEHRWKYTGTEDYETRGLTADVWEYDLTEGEMEMSYKFYVDADTGAPLKLWMFGINFYTGGHKDIYIATYYDYVPGDIPDEEFDAPADAQCDDDPEPDLAAVYRAGSPVAVLKTLLPSVHWGGDAVYDRFMHLHGRRHATSQEYHARLHEFTKNAQFVKLWNGSKGVKHRVALNRFADWTSEEYRAFVKGRRPSAADAKLLAAAGRHNVTMDPSLLPRDLIWKGSVLDGPVHDQAACGSCYAISAISALETALARREGKLQLLSAQQLMDCAWGGDTGNTGCFGGDQIRALTWVLQNQGVASESDYPYRGVNDFCRTNVRKVPLNGRIVVVEGGEEALKEALYTKGTMAVSVDAGSDEFRFYAGGVFSSDSCATKSEDLDHAVSVSGWGYDELSGEDYWLVKNMWSPYWGEEGYIRITRKPNDCGIAAQPIYVELDDE